MDLERVHLDRADVVEIREDEDVRIAVRVRHGLVVELPALRIVVRHRADERELHRRVLLLHEPVRVDHAERVLPRIEARDLCQQRSVDVDAELVDDVRRVLRRQRHVLRRQRVDRRRPDVALRKPLHLRHVLVHVEDRGVVPLDRGEQHVEHVPVRRREVDVPAPHPFCGAALEVVDHPHRLRVVHDHEVVVVRVELLRVQGLVGDEDPFLLLGQPLRVPLQRVVDRLRDVEELVGAADDPPLCLESGALHQRDQRVVDLRDAAAERGRREVDDALPLERLREPADLVHEPARRDRRVVAQRFVTDVDELEHDSLRRWTRRRG